MTRNEHGPNTPTGFDAPPHSHVDDMDESDELMALERLVRSYARVRIDDLDEQDDFVQCVLVKAWLRRQQFRGAAKFSTWVYRIARNELNTVVRRKRRHAAMLANLPACQAFASPAQPEDGIVSRIAVESLLARIPQEHSVLFRLAVEEGLTSAEIGGRLGLQAASVRSRVFRARRKLAGLSALMGLSVMELAHGRRPIRNRLGAGGSRTGIKAGPEAGGRAMGSATPGMTAGNGQ